VTVWLLAAASGKPSMSPSKLHQTGCRHGAQAARLRRAQAQEPKTAEVCLEQLVFIAKARLELGGVSQCHDEPSVTPLHCLTAQSGCKDIVRCHCVQLWLLHCHLRAVRMSCSSFAFPCLILTGAIKCLGIVPAW
jgi:hypothetical protein